MSKTNHILTIIQTIRLVYYISYTENTQTIQFPTYYYTEIAKSEEHREMRTNGGLIHDQRFGKVGTQLRHNSQFDIS